MSYRDAIRDIPTGSTWIDAAGRWATVRTAAARYVSFVADGSRGTVHESEFRRAFSPLYDRQAVRSQFSMSLANLGEFRVFWLPEHRRIMARSISCTRHFAIPEGAREVGVFSGPCKMADFFEALDFVVLRALEPAAESRAA